MFCHTPCSAFLTQTSPRKKKNFCVTFTVKLFDCYIWGTQYVVHRIAQVLLRATVRCTVSDSRNLNIWTSGSVCSAHDPQNTQRGSASTLCRPVMHYFHITIPVLKNKDDFMYRPTTALSRLRKATVCCVMRVSPSGSPRQTLLPLCGFFWNFMLVEFYKNMSTYSFLGYKGIGNEALRCVLIRVTTQVRPWTRGKPPMG